MNVLEGQVQDVVYQGDSYLVQARLPDGNMVSVRGISTTGAMAAIPRAGDPLRLGLLPEDTALIVDEAPAAWPVPGWRRVGR